MIPQNAAYAALKDQPGSLSNQSSTGTARPRYHRGGMPRTTRRIVVVGQQARGSPDFLLNDLAGTSGRLDVLVRCVRAALLVSHGLRRDTVAYLVLLGDPRAPKTLRFDGASARFIRPEERSLATLAQKMLAAGREGPGFVSMRPGIAIAHEGLSAVLAELGDATPYVLEEGAPDIREACLDVRDAAFFFGDHRGFEGSVREELAAIGAIPLGLGPVSVHAEDAVTLVVNELDRRASGAAGAEGAT
jgi:tRNA (pseudouridine54-N1)-methyltransferase